MRKVLVLSVFAAIAGCGAAMAGDGPEKSSAKDGPPASEPLYNWNGFYLGAHIGAAWGDTKFAEFPGRVSIYGDNVNTPGPLAGGQAGYNYQAGSWVIGAEADIAYAGLDGTNTCFARSGSFDSSNCHSHFDAIGSLTGRLGRVFAPYDRSLFYVRGGAAWAQERKAVILNESFEAQSASAGLWGWTAGGGVEYALSQAWSARVEYGYYGFGSSSVPTPYSVGGKLWRHGDVRFAAPTQQDLQTVKAGVNYRLGSPAGSGLSWPDIAYKERESAAGWEFEAGGRYWYSIGKFQKDLTPPSLVSRLTYNDYAGNSGELFWRIESPWNVFVKGYAGGGNLGRGHMNDEDWGFYQGAAYSNTISGNIGGSLDYVTIDAGYDFFRAPEYKLGVFAGYNRFYEKLNAYGCVQIASRNADCVGSDASPLSYLLMTETDTWDSLRAGVSGELALTGRLKLSADAAWLPVTHFTGTDHHWGWTPTKVFPASGNGNGAQFDAILSYAVTDRFSLGAGGRYWSFKTTTASYSLLPAPGRSGWGPGPYKANAEEYGMLVQGSYKFTDQAHAIPLK